jgi:hypothetical protein
LNWRIVGASVVGTSHALNDSCCQDSCWAQEDVTLQGHSLLSIFVADGAGSASHGGEGAELAMQTAAEVIAIKLRQGEFGIGDDLAVECVLAIRTALQARASSLGLHPRDFACTLLGVISQPSASLVLQIGDGGIVVNAGNGLEVPIVPMSGEYANMTNFVTDENAIEVLKTKTYASSFSQVAVFSDGIQRLALNMATNTHHEPFFSHLFKTLETASLDQEDQLHQALIRLLNSEAVNARTDDDKTLVIAALAK